MLADVTHKLSNIFKFNKEKKKKTKPSWVSCFLFIVVMANLGKLRQKYPADTARPSPINVPRD